MSRQIRTNNRTRTGINRPRIPGAVRRRIELAAHLHPEATAGQIADLLTAEGVGPLPDEKSIRRIKASVRGSGERWHAAHPLPPARRADVLRSYLAVHRAGGLSHITTAAAIRIAWLAETAPGTPPVLLYVLARAYELAESEAGGASTAALDLLLAHRPWRGVRETADYLDCIRAGKVPPAPIVFPAWERGLPDDDAVIDAARERYREAAERAEDVDTSSLPAEPGEPERVLVSAWRGSDGTANVSMWPGGWGEFVEGCLEHAEEHRVNVDSKQES